MSRQSGRAIAAMNDNLLITLSGFIESVEPVTAGDSGRDDAEKPKLLGP